MTSETDHEPTTSEQLDAAFDKVATKENEDYLEVRVPPSFLMRWRVEMTGAAKTQAQDDREPSKDIVYTGFYVVAYDGCTSPVAVDTRGLPDSEVDGYHKLDTPMLHDDYRGYNILVSQETSKALGTRIYYIVCRQADNHILLNGNTTVPWKLDHVLKTARQTIDEELGEQ